jgi:hypothetical protein
MTLWEITSYADALGRERERQLARADLRERHGRRWRTRTPRRERVLLKLGELTPASEDLPPEEPAAPTPPAPSEVEAPKPPRKRTSKAKAKPGKGQRTAAELLAEAREATAGWADDAINAEAIRTRLHCSAANSRVLRDALLSERADGRRLHTVDADTAEDGDDREGAAA